MNTLTPEQVAHFKQVLTDEKARLESELSNIGIKNPNVVGDWSPVVDEAIDVSTSDKNELADKFEDLEENTAISNTLETQLKEVSDALARIENGTYGIDEKTGEVIPADRLEANPSARENM
jgi:RNA polymerase-binding transcription factor DksA